MSYQDKYIKYKNKYLELKSVLYGGSSPNTTPLGPVAAPLGLDEGSAEAAMVANYGAEVPVLLDLSPFLLLSY